MHRFYLTLLFVLLLSCYDANAQDLVLKEVSVDTISSNSPQQIKLTWLFNSQIDTVVICRCTSNCYYENNYINDIAKLKMDEDALSWIDHDVSPTSQNYYSIHRGKGKSAPQNNMVLEAQISGECANAASLSWNSWVKYNNDKEFDWSSPYTNKRDTLDYYIFYRIKDLGDFILRDSIKGVYSTEIDPVKKMDYEVEYLANNTTYQFVIQAISRSDRVRVFSNIVECKIGIVVDKRVNVKITCVDVIEDREIKINIETDTFPDPFQKLYLFRITPSNDSFTLISNTAYNSNNTYSFMDKDVNPRSGLYYYMAVADNRCKLSDTSNVVTNIWLWGKREDKYIDHVEFYRRSPDIYESYKLVRIVYGNEYVIYDPATPYKGYSIDVLDFMEDGVMTYKVISETGCSSNTITIAHEPFLSFPNAFNPGDLNSENKTFYPIFKFLPDNDNYLFIIYNRWGQELYRSTLPPIPHHYADLQGRWNGTFQGKECPPGIYAFKIRYSFNDGAGKYSDSGSFMLVR